MRPGNPRHAASSSVATLFAQRARVAPDVIAIDDGRRRLSYVELLERVQRLAGALHARGVASGDRVAILSRNRGEYLELLLAAAWLGAVAACQSWRLAPRELSHCLDLVEPALVVAAPVEAELLVERHEPLLLLGDDYERALAQAEPLTQPRLIDDESVLLILYTSGTTGLPKGAAISHRAEIVRNLVMRAELGIATEDAYIAWTPLYHMGGAEFSLGTLMSGGTVFVVDGFDVEHLCALVAEQPLGWLLLMPGMVGRFADALERHAVTPRGVRVCGVMADLVPPQDIARVTRLLDAPYVNTFGATETGCPPASSSLIRVGVEPGRLSKRQSPYCEVRLVDEHDRDVAPGTPGELLMRGPTLFSGYWRDEEATARDFRDGWFHLGDVFVRNDDGTLDFVDRRKTMIKSGGENIYPAEIERVLLALPGVEEAAVVGRADPTWGEVPVAFVACSDPALDAEALRDACGASIARFKTPKAFVLIDADDFPRSASGKVQRHELARRLAEGPR